jgi:hypothetical protein
MPIYLGFPVCLQQAIQILGKEFIEDGTSTKRMRLLHVDQHINQVLENKGMVLRLIPFETGIFVLGYKLDECKPRDVDNFIMYIKDQKKELLADLAMVNADFTNVQIEWMGATQETTNPEPFIFSNN